MSATDDVLAMTRPFTDVADYEQTVRTFQWVRPAQFNFGYDIIDYYAQNPDQRAMLWVDSTGATEDVRDLSYAYFRDRSNQVANALRALGIGKGDKVMVIMSRIVEWWETMVGLMKLGAVAMPGTTQLTPKDIAYRVQAGEAKGAIVDTDNAAKFDGVAAQCPTLTVKVVAGGTREGWRSYADIVDAAPTTIERVPTAGSDPLLLYFTSGTTGYPKMVLHTHISYPVGHMVTGRYWLALTQDDLHWNMSDTGWAKAAWSSLFGPWDMGAALFVHNFKGKYTAAETFRLLTTYNVTSFCAPPTVYRMLVVEDLSQYTLPALRSCIGAGEPLNPEVIATWQRMTGLTIRDGYGQTETVLLSGNFPGLPVKPGSMGRPMPGFTIAVIDDDGQPLPPNREGDVAVLTAPERPVGLFQEYWNNADATRNAHRGDWYVTGDRAYQDEEGYLWFVGRADDVILSSAYRIGPFEVESALIEHPAVMEAAVIGKPDPTRGEIVKAFVILKPGIEGTPALVVEIQDFVKNLTAPYKYPREIEFVAELPKTISGKIRRIELRERERAKL